jgi:hypothetical protein
MMTENVIRIPADNLFGMKLGTRATTMRYKLAYENCLSVILYKVMLNK